MSLFDRIGQDVKDAMKTQDKERLEVLRMLKSKLLENKTSKAPREESEVVTAYTKQLKDSLELFPSGSSQQEKINSELKVLATYLPKQLSDDDVRVMIKDILTSIEGPNFGAVMKTLTLKIKGQFDGKRAADLVKEVIG